MHHLSRASVSHGLEWTDRNAKIVVACLVLGLLAVGMAYSLYLGNLFRFGDERAYWVLGSTIASDFNYGEVGSQAYRPPGYPALLSLIIALDAPVWMGRFLNFILLSGSAICLYDLGRRFARPAAGVVAACWIAGYPLFTYTAGTLYPQTLAGFLLLLTLCWASRRSAVSLACSGLVCGALILVVPTFAALAVVVAIWTAFRPHGFSWRRPLLFCFIAALTVAPWIARNHSVLGHWVFVSTNSGVNLALGNSPDTQRGSGVNVDLSHIQPASDLSEVRRSQAFTNAALTWMRQHPLPAARLYLSKLAHYFAVTEQLATKAQANPLYAYILGITYAPLLAVLVLRLVMFRWFPWSSIELLVIALYLSFGIVMAVFFTRIRFRVPLDYALLLVVGIFLTRLTERLAHGANAIRGRYGEE